MLLSFICAFSGSASSSKNDLEEGRERKASGQLWDGTYVFKNDGANINIVNTHMYVRQCGRVESSSQGTVLELGINI